MLDYLVDMFIQSSKLIKFMIITFIFLITCALIFSLYVNYEKMEENNHKTYHGTTTRRDVPTTIRPSTKSTTTTTTTTTTTMPTTELFTSDQTEIIIPTTTKPTTKSTIKTGTTRKTTTTKKKTTTTKKTTNKTTTKNTPTRKVTEESTTYPNALDFWEWNIVDMINDARVKKGLKKLQVAVDLRDLAEQTADYWYDHTAAQVQSKLNGHRFYARQLTHANMLESYKHLYNLTEYYTDVTKNKYYNYVGVGVIYYDRSANGLPTHYYIIVYE